MTDAKDSAALPSAPTASCTKDYGACRKENPSACIPRLIRVNRVPTSSGVRKSRNHSAAATPPTALLRTCHNCHQAKIKCKRNTEVGPCIRCERLGKVCHFSAAQRRPNNPHRDSRIEALEAQVQQLLDGQAGLTNKNAESSDQLTTESASSARSVTSSPSLETKNAAVSSGTLRNAIFTPSATSTADAIGNGLLSADTAEVLLQRFKTDLTPHFPFVVVPPHDHVKTLRHKQPFLLLCILAAASFDDVVLQRRLGREVQHAIAAKMIYGHTVSLEALQALLVHLAWCQYHPRPRRYTQCLQLAVGIIVDLRLDRQPDSRPWKTRIDLTKATDTQEFLGLDEQRAIAGCYYLCSTVSTLLQKLCTFPWSRHVDDCCRALYTQQQYPTDRYIHNIVQLQHIMEEADVGNAHATPTIRPGDPAVESTDNSKSSHITQLRTKLESIKEAMPFTLMECPLLMMQYNTVLGYLCHASICVDTELNALPTGESWSPWRLNALGTGLIAAKSSLSHFLSLPLGSEMHFNNSEWIQLGFGLTYSARFATLSEQRAIQQETQHLRNFLGMSDILKDVSRRLGALSTTRIDDDGEKDVFHHYQQRVERLQAWFNLQSRGCQITTSEASPAVANVDTSNTADTQLHQPSPKNGKLAWNTRLSLSPRYDTIMAMDNAWPVEEQSDFGTAGELFPQDLMDMANFGQYFAFDAENI